MKTKEEIDKIIYNKFGMNAGYVADQFEKYNKDKNSVDEYWKVFFSSLNSDDNIPPKPVEDVPQKSDKKNAEPILLDGENIEQILGVGARIIENMESSLSNSNCYIFKSNFSKIAGRK